MVQRLEALESKLNSLIWYSTLFFGILVLACILLITIIYHGIRDTKDFEKKSREAADRSVEAARKALDSASRAMDMVREIKRRVVRTREIEKELGDLLQGARKITIDKTGKSIRGIKLLPDNERKKDVEKLILALKHEDHEDRASTAFALGKIGERGSVPVLLQHLINDEDDYVRATCAIALGLIADGKAFRDLIITLEDKSWLVRKWSAFALGMLGDGASVENLIEATRDVEQGVRMEAILALGNIGDKKAVPALIESLEDKKAPVRAAAAVVLGDLREQRAVPNLIDALMDENQSVRYMAALALEKAEDEGLDKGD